MIIDEKESDLDRIRSNAANINFETIGIATASEKDELQTIKGIGPFIEEKLNALGIYTYLQISKMSGSFVRETHTKYSKPLEMLVMKHKQNFQKFRKCCS